MSKVKVFLVDDSLAVRMILESILDTHAATEVIDTAQDGVIAMNKLKSCQPDVVILDIEMPNMDGLATLKAIRQLYPDLPVIMCSSLTERGSKVTLQCLMRGANEFITKPTFSSVKQSREEITQEFSTILIEKIRGVCQKKNTPQQPAQSTQSTQSTQTTVPIGQKNIKPIAGTQAPVKSKAISTRQMPSHKIDLIAVGASTGGPAALTEVLPKLPSDLSVPVLVVLHMPGTFTKTMAAMLNKKSQLPVVEAHDDIELEAGTIYLAPGDYHMVLNRSHQQKWVLQLNQNDKVNYCRPAVDVLFESIAKMRPKQTLGIILTGMGSDGLRGCQQLVDGGGAVFVQDEATSAVWGMPGVVANAGIASKILPLTSIPNAIIDCVRAKK